MAGHPCYAGLFKSVYAVTNSGHIVNVLSVRGCPCGAETILTVCSLSKVSPKEGVLSYLSARRVAYVRIASARMFAHRTSRKRWLAARVAQASRW